MAHAQQPVDRPRVGLALGGGAARGIAHVGVLEWFEEHRIPVDVIAGTSMGGLVGGLYAAGLSAAEVRTSVAGVDWGRLFGGEIEYAHQSYRRKEDRRAYPVRNELGLRDGLRLVQSLEPGHYVEQLLSRLVLPHAVPLEFDDLPIAFRSIATDLEAATVVEIESGSLASALRATMAIPGVFQPVERDGLLLADGGMLNNVPADVVGRMGADVVIAVDVSVPLHTREEMQSWVGLAGQALTLMMNERTRNVLTEHADHVIVPPLDGLSLMDWRRFDTIRERGYRAAAEAGEELAYLSLSPAAWERHLEERRLRDAASPVVPQFVRVDGVPGQDAEEVARAIEPVLGTELDPDELELRLTLLAGRGRYGSLGYDLARDGDRAGIVVRARDKPHGPPFLDLVTEVEYLGSKLDLSGGTRLTIMDAGTRDAELRLDLALELGWEADALLDYYLPVGGSTVFLAPRIGLHSRRHRVTADEDHAEEYRARRGLAAFDLGVAFGPRSELRIGYEGALLRAHVESGASSLQDLDGWEHGGRATWVYDGHDHWLVPGGGTRIETEARWMATVPGQPSGFVQARLTSSTFFSVGRGGRVFFTLAGSTTFDDQLAPFYQSTLGGPFRLGAFDRDRFRGVSTGYLGTGYLHQVGRLPDLLGGAIYAGAWVESGRIKAGDALTKSGQPDPGTGVSGGLLVDTLLGAVFASGSIASGSRRLHVGLGRPPW
ncbi:MAG: patatin-like phospholipase family protein [Gemmatimonadota bacterium]|nr:patatin-like phospholipase family protein [Gemmatimonadota bacterium]